MATAAGYYPRPRRARGRVDDRRRRRLGRAVRGPEAVRDAGRAPGRWTGSSRRRERCRDGVVVVGAGRARCRRARASWRAARHAAESVRRGLAAVPADADDRLVHDAARPFAVAGAVRRGGRRRARRRRRRRAGLPVTDTVKRGRRRRRRGGARSTGRRSWPCRPRRRSGPTCCGAAHADRRRGHRRRLAGRGRRWPGGRRGRRGRQPQDHRARRPGVGPRTGSSPVTDALDRRCGRAGLRRPPLHRRPGPSGRWCSAGAVPRRARAGRPQRRRRRRPRRRRRAARRGRARRHRPALPRHRPALGGRRLDRAAARGRAARSAAAGWAAGQRRLHRRVRAPEARARGGPRWRRGLSDAVGAPVTVKGRRAEGLGALGPARGHRLLGRRPWCVGAAVSGRRGGERPDGAAAAGARGRRPPARPVAAGRRRARAAAREAGDRRRAGRRRAREGLGGEQVEGRQAVRELLARRPPQGARGLGGAATSRTPASSPTSSSWPPLDACPGAGGQPHASSRPRPAARRPGRAGQGRTAPEADLDDLLAALRPGRPRSSSPSTASPTRATSAPCCARPRAPGVTGVVLPRHRAVHVTPTVAKAAAGAIEHLPIAVVRGLPAALQTVATQPASGSWASTTPPTGAVRPRRPRRRADRARARRRGRRACRGWSGSGATSSSSIPMRGACRR